MFEKSDILNAFRMPMVEWEERICKKQAAENIVNIRTVSTFSNFFFVNLPFSIRNIIAEIF
jgi:hypothetical protein